MTDRDLMAELRERLRSGSPGIARLRADLAERTRIAQAAAEQAAADRDTDRGGPASSDPLRNVLRRKLEAGKIRVRPDGRIERTRDVQGGT